MLLLREKMLPLCLLLTMGLIACQANRKEERSLLSFVDPFIGTGAHGHTFPGATTPFGAVQLSPDTHLMGWEASSGYHYEDSLIYGFSHTHLSGTGIGDLGDVLLLPFTGTAHDSLVAHFHKEGEEARPGYYSVKFDNFPIEVELTASPRVGFHRYQFEGEEAQVMLDLGHILQANWGHKSTGGSLEIVDDYTLKGSKISSGWAYDHRVYFFAQFSQPMNLLRVTNEGNPIEGHAFRGKDLKAFFTFSSSEPLLIKVGISAVDEAGAEKNLKQELPHWDFDQVVGEAEALWQKELESIDIQSNDSVGLTNFYTAMYHSMMAPFLHQDVDGRYRGMDRKIYTAKGGYVNYTVFSLWDTFRAWGPLFSVIDKERLTAWLEVLLQKNREGGVLPKWPLASNYTGTMVGYPSAAFFADAVAKDMGAFDEQELLDALTFASTYSPNFSLQEPRGAGVKPKHLQFISELGYIPADSLAGSVSYGLECAYYDGCIAKIAEKWGYDTLASHYASRSQYYQNYFNPRSGFMEGKLAGEKWKENFSPFQSDFHGDYIEGNAWQWSWFVPHDLPGFIDLYGGSQGVIHLLDSLFHAPEQMEGEEIPGDLTGLIGQYAHGNEPSHHVAYLYNYLGKPESTQEKISYILKEFYRAEPGGIIGNEDCGQMSAWYVLSSLGIYQVCPGDTRFTLGRPLFERAVIHLENGKTFIILADELEAESTYVQTIYLNGHPLEEPFIDYQDIMNGGELIFEMKPITP